MKFRVVVIIGLLSSILTGESKPFGEFELESLSEYEQAEVKRDKRTLTTICVEIKPSSPYEEPYFMCKGTDMQQFPKGGGSYSGGGGGNPSYTSKPSFNSKPSSEYHGPVKSDYHSGESKYGKPPSDSDGSHSAYSSYEAPKPSSYSHDDYAKPAPIKPSYEKPSPHYEPPYPTKPQSYGHDSPSYGHSDSSEYSKPSYSKPISYSDHSTYAPSKQSYSEPSSKHSYSESKPSYGQSGASYSAASKPTGYSKPSSYSSKPVMYENSDISSKPSYGEQKLYSKPVQTGYNKPAYSADSYSTPTAKPYTSSDKGYGPSGYGKPAYPSDPYGAPATKPYSSSDKGYTNDHPASYGKPAHASDSYNALAAKPKVDYSSHSRSMPDDIMQPMWDMQPQSLQDDSFGYRSMGTPINQEHQYTYFDGPTRMDISGGEGPTLGSAYFPYAPDSAYGPSPSYSPPAPSYAPVAPSYPQPNPYYTPAPPAYIPSYTPAAPPYTPATTPYTASYTPAAPSYGSAYAQPPQVYNPSCPSSYLYSFQPAIISLPCLSPQPGYGQLSYGQSLGAPHSTTLGESHHLYPSNINPLQEMPTSRSEGKDEPGKPGDESSKSEESQESDKKTDKPKAAKSSESIKKQPELTAEKPAEKKQEQAAVAEKPKDDQTNTGTMSNKGSSDGSDTKQAYEAMIRMSKIAAQLKKDDSIPAGDQPGAIVLGSDKPAGTQFGRT